MSFRIGQSPLNNTRNFTLERSGVSSHLDYTDSSEHNIAIEGAGISDTPPRIRPNQEPPHKKAPQSSASSDNLTKTSFQKTVSPATPSSIFSKEEQAQIDLVQYFIQYSDRLDVEPWQNTQDLLNGLLSIHRNKISTCDLENEAIKSALKSLKKDVNKFEEIVVKKAKISDQPLVIIKQTSDQEISKFKELDHEIILRTTKENQLQEISHLQATFSKAERILAEASYRFNSLKKEELFFLKSNIDNHEETLERLKRHPSTNGEEDKLNEKLKKLQNKITENLLKGPIQNYVELHNKICELYRQLPPDVQNANEGKALFNRLDSFQQQIIRHAIEQKATIKITSPLSDEEHNSLEQKPCINLLEWAPLKDRIIDTLTDYSSSIISYKELANLGYLRQDLLTCLKTTTGWGGQHLWQLTKNTIVASTPWIAAYTLHYAKQLMENNLVETTLNELNTGTTHLNPTDKAGIIEWLVNCPPEVLAVLIAFNTLALTWNNSPKSALPSLSAISHTLPQAIKTAIKLTAIAGATYGVSSIAMGKTSIINEVLNNPVPIAAGTSALFAIFLTKAISGVNDSKSNSIIADEEGDANNPNNVETKEEEDVHPVSPGEAVSSGQAPNTNAMPLNTTSSKTKQVPSVALPIIGLGTALGIGTRVYTEYSLVGERLLNVLPSPQETLTGLTNQTITPIFNHPIIATAALATVVGIAACRYRGVTLSDAGSGIKTVGDRAYNVTATVVSGTASGAVAAVSGATSTIKSFFSWGKKPVEAAKVDQEKIGSPRKQRRSSPQNTTKNRGRSKAPINKR